MEKVYFVMVDKVSAEKTRRLLLDESLFNKDYAVLKDKDKVLLPLIKKYNKIKSLDSNNIKYKLAIREVGKLENVKVDYLSELREILNDDDYNSLVKGYDLLGNIIILDIPDSLIKYEKRIAKVFLKSNKNVETVLKKNGPVEGIYRVRPIKYVLGKHSFMANYKENGCEFVFDVRKVFFSIRLAYERNRISNLISDNENVCVPFAGVGPFAIEISKKHPNTNIVAIELNKYGYFYMKKNIKLNNLNNIKPVLADFNEFAKTCDKKFDRIVMPMPKSSLSFLDSAFKLSKNNTFVHIYTFCESDKIDEVKSMILKHAKDNNYKVEFKLIRKVRTYSKSIIEIVVDYKIVSNF